jgi:hypothetical protein
MRAAGPAARPALAFFELCTYALDMFASCFGLFYGDGPADPFIARERRDVFPCGERGLVGGKGCPQIRRDFVYDAAGDCFPGHMFFLTDWINRPGTPRDKTAVRGKEPERAVQIRQHPNQYHWLARSG